MAASDGGHDAVLRSSIGGPPASSIRYVPIHHFTNPLVVFFLIGLKRHVQLALFALPVYRWVQKLQESTWLSHCRRICEGINNTPESLWSDFINSITYSLRKEYQESLLIQLWYHPLVVHTTDYPEKGIRLCITFCGIRCHIIMAAFFL